VLRQVRQIALPTALAMTLSAGAAFADPLPLRPVLTLEAARTVVRAAEAKATAEGWPCVISVVDTDGLPIILERMDDAAVPAGVELAPGKPERRLSSAGRAERLRTQSIVESVPPSPPREASS
jgi:glc operon protein GlcG